jgi:hypothetical protein
MAITFSTSVTNNSGTGAVSLSLGTTVVPTDLLVAVLAWSNGDVIYTPSITDTVNSGNWIFPAAYQFNAGGGFNPQLAVAYKLCNGSGTPTVNATGGDSGIGMYLSVAKYTGVVHGPSLVTADSSINNGTSTTAAASGVTNSFANEVTVCYAVNANGNFAGAPTGSFTIRQGGTSGPISLLGDVISSSSGNALSFSASVSPSAIWAVGLLSFQDTAIAANTAPIAWIT